MPIWHIIGRTCFGLRAFERGRLRKIPGLPTECVPLRAQPNPTQHCKPMQRMWRHHGHDSAVQLGGRPSLHHPSSHHPSLRQPAVTPGGQRAGNDCSKCAHMSTITRLRLDAALHEPAASRDPGQGGRLRRKGVTPALTQKHPQPPAFTSSTRPQPPAHHVEVIALKTTRSQAGDDLHLVDLQCDSLIP